MGGVGGFEGGKAEEEERAFLEDAYLDVDGASEGWDSRYVSALGSAGSDDLSDLHRLGFLRSLGRDASGRRAFLVVGSRLPAAAFGDASVGRWVGWVKGSAGGAGGQDAKGETPAEEARRCRERLVRYFARRLHRAASEGPYTVLYAHSGCQGGLASALAPGHTAWAWQVYGMLPRFYKDHLAKLVVVHPTLALRVNLAMLGRVVAPRLWAKVEYVHRIEWLAPAAFSRAALASQLPADVREHDALLESQPLLDYGVYASSADGAAGLALGAMGFSGATLPDAGGAGRADPTSRLGLTVAKAAMGFAG